MKTKEQLKQLLDEREQVRARLREIKRKRREEYDRIDEHCEEKMRSARSWKRTETEAVNELLDGEREELLKRDVELSYKVSVFLRTGEVDGDINKTSE